MKKILALLLAMVMVIGLVACGGGEKAPETTAPKADAPVAEAPATEPAPADDGAPVTDLPRNETLYFAGQQWGTVNSWNVIGANQNNAMALAGDASGYRTLMFETLYMYDFLTGELKPPWLTATMSGTKT